MPIARAVPNREQTLATTFEPRRILSTVCAMRVTTPLDALANPSRPGVSRRRPRRADSRVNSSQLESHGGSLIANDGVKQIDCPLNSPDVIRGGVVS